MKKTFIKKAKKRAVKRTSKWLNESRKRRPVNEAFVNPAAGINSRIIISKSNISAKRYGASFCTDICNKRGPKYNAQRCSIECGSTSLVGSTASKTLM